VQLDSSRSQAAAGLGLGLALARSLITLHKGEITARSAGPGKGSEFRIRLPLVAAPAHAHEETKAPPLAHAARRVLVVDDNVDAATSLGMLLLTDRPRSRPQPGCRRRWLSSISTCRIPMGQSSPG
jgi:hypothetical protein